MSKSSWAVITDLDGSFLNHHNYQWSEALPAVKSLQDKNIPIIFNTSKTYSETVVLQKQVGISAPFIIENGSCIYLPKLQFPDLPSPFAESYKSYWQIKLGNTVKEIDRYVNQIILPDDQFSKLSDFSAEQASQLTGLSLEQSKNAIAREYSQPILWEGSESQLGNFKIRLEKQGLSLLRGGRFLHIQGNSDKGKAIRKLQVLYSHTLNTIVIGDSGNDLEMLNEADISIIIKAPGNQYLLDDFIPTYISNLEAPKGWAEAINFVFQNYNLGGKI